MQLERQLLQIFIIFIWYFNDFFANLQLYIVFFVEVQFKERDVLEGILKFWRNDDSKYFDIPTLW